MKRTTDKTIRHRKLVLRGETITELTPLQLTKVAGGWTIGFPCRDSELEKACVDETIG